MLSSKTKHRYIQEEITNIRELLAIRGPAEQEVQRKQAAVGNRLQEEISGLQQICNSLVSRDDQEKAEEISKQKQKLLLMDKDIEKKLKELELLQLKVKEAESLLEEIREQHKASEKKLPRARYAVNLFRDISNVRWHIAESPSEVRGIILSQCDKSNLKTFSFNEQKQSKFFITSSLWEMGDEELW